MKKFLNSLIKWFNPYKIPEVRPRFDYKFDGLYQNRKTYRVYRVECSGNYLGKIFIPIGVPSPDDTMEFLAYQLSCASDELEYPGSIDGAYCTRY